MPRPDRAELGGDDCLAPQPLTESVSPALVGSCTPPTQPQHTHSNIHASVETTSHNDVQHDPPARPADHVTCAGADAQMPPATPPTVESASVVAQHPGAVVGHTSVVVAASTTTASTTTKIRQADLAAAIRSRVFNGSFWVFWDWHCDWKFSGSVTFWNWSESADPYHRFTDPDLDPVLFFSGLQDTNK